MQQIRVPMPPPHFEAPRPMRPMRPPLSPIELGGSSRLGQTPANPPPYFLRNQTSSPHGPSPKPMRRTNSFWVAGCCGSLVLRLSDHSQASSTQAVGCWKRPVTIAGKSQLT
jgi:hypothetical protein